MNFRNALASALYSADFGGALERDNERKAREKEQNERERRFALDDYDRTGRWDEKILGPRPDKDEKVDTGAMDDDDRRAINSGLKVGNRLARQMGGIGVDIGADGVGKTDKWREGPVPELKYDYTKSKEYADIKALADARRKGARESFEFARAAKEEHPDLDFQKTRHQQAAGRGNAYVSEASDRAEHKRNFDEAVAAGVFRIPNNRGMERIAMNDPAALRAAMQAFQSENDPDTVGVRNARALSTRADQMRIDQMTRQNADAAREAEDEALTERARKAAQVVLSLARKETNGDEMAAFDTAISRAGGNDRLTQRIRELLAEARSEYEGTVSTGRARMQGNTPVVDAERQRADAAINAVMADDSLDEAEKRERVDAIEEAYASRTGG